MKLYKVAMLSLISSFFMVGCSVEMESPEKLITQKAVYNEVNYELYKNVEQFVRANELMLPLNSKDVGKINSFDINNDGLNEIIAFKKTQIPSEDSSEPKYEVGFVCLQKNVEGKYEISDTVSVEGNSIEYANFYDLDNNGRQEIIVLYKNGDKFELFIYELNDDKTFKVHQIKPNLLLQANSNFESIKIKVDYVDEDDILDIVIINQNLQNGKTYITVGNYKKSFVTLASTTIDDITNLSRAEITIGNINEHKRGIVLDYLIKDDTRYRTQVVYLENRKLERAFRKDNNLLDKPYHIKSQDINGDNIIDIGLAAFNLGTANNLKSYELVNWYNYSKDSEDGTNLKFLNQAYYNYSYDYKLTIPNNLKDKIVMHQVNNNEDINFEFNYIDEVKGMSKIFTINAKSKKISTTTTNSTQETKPDTASTGTPIGESSIYTFTLIRDNEELLEKLGLDMEYFLKNFKIIY